MKLYLILLVLLAVIWLWRAKRQSDPRLQRQNAKPPPAPLPMVRCAFCAIHTPVVEAVQGKKGLYCSADHRLSAES